MSDHTLDDRLRAQVEQRVTLKTRFAGHAATYLLVNAGMVLFNLASTPDNLWSLWSAGCWGVALVLQGVAAYGHASDWRARAVEAELARLHRASRD